MKKDKFNIWYVLLLLALLAQIIGYYYFTKYWE